jgi:hypothetical protein
MLQSLLTIFVLLFSFFSFLPFSFFSFSFLFFSFLFPLFLFSFYLFCLFFFSFILGWTSLAEPRPPHDPGIRSVQPFSRLGMTRFHLKQPATVYTTTNNPDTHLIASASSKRNHIRPCVKSLIAKFILCLLSAFLPNSCLFMHVSLC